MAARGPTMALFSIAFAFAFGVAACGGGAGASFDGKVYKKGPIAFELPDPPSGWKRIEMPDATLAFRDDAHDASVLLNARCLSADDRTPLLALTNHLLIGATEREYVGQTTEPFDGREALHTTVRAKWDGVPLFIDAFVLSKDGCVYDFVYLGAPPESASGAPVFEGFVRRFHTLRGSGLV